MNAPAWTQLRILHARRAYFAVNALLAHLGEDKALQAEQLAWSDPKTTDTELKILLRLQVRRSTNPNQLLRAALHHKHQPIRELAAQLVFEPPHKALPLEPERPALTDKEELIPDLAQQLTDTNPKSKRNAARALQAIRCTDPAKLQPVLALLTHPPLYDPANPDRKAMRQAIAVRCWAASALCYRHTSPEVQTAVLAAWNTPGVLARGRLTQLLLRCPDQAAIEQAWLTQLDCPSSVAALAQLKKPEHRQVFLDLLNSPDPGVVNEAALALQDLVRPEDIPWLQVVRDAMLAAIPTPEPDQLAPRWVDRNELLNRHRTYLATINATDHIHDRPLLRKILRAPLRLWDKHPHIHPAKLCARYFWGLVTGKPFARANDHAAEIAVRIFTQENGWTLHEAAWGLNLAQLVQQGNYKASDLARHFAHYLQVGTALSASKGASVATASDFSDYLNVVADQLDRTLEKARQYQEGRKLDTISFEVMFREERLVRFANYSIQDFFTGLIKGGLGLSNKKSLSWRDLVDLIEDAKVLE